ncbi:hypothetical protein ACQKMY_25885 [Peribacillus frigoritolerans]|uniref:hypothetical protein n=1 Tax=Peribacillus frigoritolerans TaxID=450367 RepID=UPI003D01D39A
MTDAMEKVLLGLKETEIIKRPPPSPIDDEKIQRFFDVSKQQIIFPPFGINRARIRDKEEAPKPTEPTS